MESAKLVHSCRAGCGPKGSFSEYGRNGVQNSIGSAVQWQRRFMCYEDHPSFSVFVARDEIAVSLLVAGAIFSDLGLSLLQHECRSYILLCITELLGPLY